MKPKLCDQCSRNGSPTCQDCKAARLHHLRDRAQRMQITSDESDELEQLLETELDKIAADVNPFQPTYTEPGSLERMAVYCKRLSHPADIALHQPGDVNDVSFSFYNCGPAGEQPDMDNGLGVKPKHGTKGRDGHGGRNLLSANQLLSQPLKYGNGNRTVPPLPPAAQILPSTQGALGPGPS